MPNCAEVPIMEVGEKENKKTRKTKLGSQTLGVWLFQAGVNLGIVESWVNTFYTVCSKSLYNVSDMKSTDEFSKSFTKPTSWRSSRPRKKNKKTNKTKDLSRVKSKVYSLESPSTHHQSPQLFESISKHVECC